MHTTGDAGRREERGQQQTAFEDPAVMWSAER
jgi:hypothetical protein